METANTEQDASKIYDYAAGLMLVQKKDRYDTKLALIERGLDEEAANLVIDNIENQVSAAKRARANKDMLWGAVWCIGGTVATLSHIGFIFWGAMLFGAIQFIKGVINATNN